MRNEPKNTLLWLLPMAVVALCSAFTSEGSAQTPPADVEIVIPQHVDPITDHTCVAFDVVNDGVTPSKDVPLEIGKRINVVGPPSAQCPDFPEGAPASDLGLLNRALDPATADNPFVVQRLTERSYFIEAFFHSVTAFVGNHGVLIIDAPNVVPPLPPAMDTDGARLIKAVRSFTDKPITRMIYSHPHQDHVGSAEDLKSRLGPNFKIIGTKWAKKAIRRYGLPLPQPDIVIKSRVANFYFENNPNFKFRIVTPEPAAHTTADSYIITPDRVLHVVDIIHSGRIPFVGNSVVMSQEGWVRMLRYLAGEKNNYDFINPGHENIAYYEDVQRTMDFTQALFNKWWELVQNNGVQPNPNQFFAFIDVDGVPQDNSIVWLRNWFDAMAERILVGFPPISGVLNDMPFLNSVPYIEAGRDHAAKVNEDLFLNRYTPINAMNVPSFDPLPPPQSCNDLDADDCDDNQNVSVVLDN